MSSNDPRRYPRTLRLHSGCLVVTIPPTLARRLGWTVGNQIAIRQEGQEIVLSYVHLGTTPPTTRSIGPCRTARTRGSSKRAGRSSPGCLGTATIRPDRRPDSHGGAEGRGGRNPA
jgi:hypothetical protein